MVVSLLRTSRILFAHSTIINNISLIFVWIIPLTVCSYMVAKIIRTLVKKKNTKHIFKNNKQDVAPVVLDLVCLSLFCFFMSFQTDWMMIRSDLCLEHWLLSEKNLFGLLQLTAKWKCKLIFTGTLQQKIEITDLKPFFWPPPHICSIEKLDSIHSSILVHTKM